LRLAGREFERDRQTAERFSLPPCRAEKAAELGKDRRVERRELRRARQHVGRLNEAPVLPQGEAEMAQRMQPRRAFVDEGGESRILHAPERKRVGGRRLESPAQLRRHALHSPAAPRST